MRVNYSIAEAAKALNLTTRTVRRRIKEGKIKAELVPGHHGDEYRIIELPSSPVVVTETEKTVTQLIQEIERLNQENRDLALSLGQAREKILQLEAPRRPWWSRLFR